MPVPDDAAAELANDLAIANAQVTRMEARCLKRATTRELLDELRMRRGWRPRIERLQAEVAAERERCLKRATTRELLDELRMRGFDPVTNG